MFSLERLNSMLRGRCTEEELEEYLLTDARNIYCTDPLNEAWNRVGLKGDMERIALLLQNFSNGTPERYGFLENGKRALCDRLRCTRFADPAIKDADIGAEKLLMDYIVCVVRDGYPLQGGLHDLYNDSAESVQSMTSTEYLALLSVVMIRKTSLTWFEQEVQPLKKELLVSYQKRHPDAGRFDSSWYLPNSAEGWKAGKDYIQDIAEHDLPDVLENLPDNSKIKAVCTDPKVVKGLLCGQTPNTNSSVKSLEVYLENHLKFNDDEQEPLDKQAKKLAACMEKNWETLFGDLFQPKQKGAKLPQRGLQMVLRLLLGASTGMMGGEAAQRNSIIRAAFAIDGNVETLDCLLYSFDLAGIDYKDANEQIFAWALKNRKNYDFASLMAKVYSLRCENEWVSAEAEQSEWRPTQYWKQDSVHQYGNTEPEDFLTYLRENGFRTGKRKISGMQHVFTSREYYTLRRFSSLKLCIMKEEYDKICEMSKTVQYELKALNMGRVEESQKNDYLMWRDATLADESTIYSRIKEEITDVAFCCFDPENDYQRESLMEEISLLIGQLKKGDLLARSQFFLLSLCEHKVRGAPASEFFKNLENDLKNSRYEPVDETFEKELLDKAKAMLDREHDER